MPFGAFGRNMSDRSIDHIRPTDEQIDVMIDSLLVWDKFVGPKCPLGLSDTRCRIVPPLAGHIRPMQFYK